LTDDSLCHASKLWDFFIFCRKDADYKPFENVV
jgi:hypothetical protein